MFQVGSYAARGSFQYVLHGSGVLPMSLGFGTEHLLILLVLRVLKKVDTGHASEPVGHGVFFFSRGTPWNRAGVFFSFSINYARLVCATSRPSSRFLLLFQRSFASICKTAGGVRTKISIRVLQEGSVSSAPSQYSRIMPQACEVLRQQLAAARAEHPGKGLRVAGLGR